MSEGDKLPERVVFPFEEQLDAERFSETPVLAIFKYMECFREDGDQAFEIPRHVLQALAKSFAVFCSGDCHSLDAAFGDQTRRQWQNLTMSGRNDDVLFDYFFELDEARELPKSERIGTPTEHACAVVAKLHCMSEDNVKAIVKNAGRLRRSRPKRRKLD